MFSLGYVVDNLTDGGVYDIPPYKVYSRASNLLLCFQFEPTTVLS